MTNKLCPLCKEVITKLIITGKKKEDYCYWCYNCKDRIAKEAVIIKEKNVS